MVYEGRVIFLREFIREVVKQIPQRPEWAIQEQLVQLTQRTPVVIPQRRPELVRLAPVQPKIQKPQSKVLQRPPQKTQSAPMQKSIASEKPAILTNIPKAEGVTGPLLPKSGTKIQQFLRDPTVIGLECPGPGKNIVINRQGRIQPIQLALTEEEIKAILDEVSTETKIPIVGGIFKTAYQSVMVTAVISEFVGTRFIIEKRPRSPETPIKR